MISIITQMGQVKSVKDFQWLMGCLMALGNFVSRLGEHGLPLQKLLKKFEPFRWTDEVQKVLEDLKALIPKSLVLASPEPGETLLLLLWFVTMI
jgi:Zn-dependent M32 family carboxypeptidase